MFSSKENVNILTSLLIANGVERAVVCPGSRNAPIVHNLCECGAIKCTPVTDERSAGFMAIGMIQATGRPVAVCVTSGTALLNLAPAVAEAYYQHRALIVISADRPSAWVGQLDGQTMPQADALGHFVRKAVTLPEPADDTARWHCNRLVNEALCQAVYRTHAPVHINVPISEPLFDFSTAALPVERIVRAMPTDESHHRYSALEHLFLSVRRPMVVIGQMDETAIDTQTISELSRTVVVLHEPLGCGSGTVHFDEVLHNVKDSPAYQPDLVLYAGGTIVSKRARRFLRTANAPTCLLTLCAADMPDPTMQLTGVVECHDTADLNNLLHNLAHATDTANCSPTATDRAAFHSLWAEALATASRKAADHEPPFSQMAVVKYFEEQLDDMECDFSVHYANSSAIRLANIYAGHYVWCNRGMNGIEGSLSTAAGFSIATAGRVFCIIGDLSFFYDQNALWNSCIGGNLRIIMINNHGGGIFHTLPGLEHSDAHDTMVAGAHHTEARGICTQNDIGYMKAHNMQEMRLGIVTLLTRESARPMLLEVFTDSDEDHRAMNEYLAK